MERSRCLWDIPHWQELLSQSQVILELLNGCVALTGAFFESPAVHDLHCTSHIIYNSPFLQYGRCLTHRGPVGTHHGCNEIVGDRKNFGMHAILSHQEAPRETLLYIVQPVAGGSLCNLHSLQPGMPVQYHL